MVKAPGTGNPRGRGKYNPACDVCARKKTKCDGNKPLCQPCRLQGREGECTWTKNPVRKPRTEQHFEAMRKRVEALQSRTAEWHRYADYLESILDNSSRDLPHRPTPDFRAARPPDDGLLGDIFDHDFDPSLPGHDDGDTNSDPGDPTKELCNPTQSLKLEENGLLHHYGNTAVFRFDNVEPHPTRLSRFPTLAQNPDATYVLLTDGVNDGHYNPDFPWFRHLPNIVPLDRRSHDKALDLIFKFFTSWCLRVVPALFLRDMYRALSVPASSPPPKTPHYSPMLHNALVALGLAFLDDPKLRDLKARQYFANKAKSYIETECATPNLSVVNALSIIASFHSSQGDQTLGYLYFGMSARMAQAMGLNVDCSEWVKMGVMDESDLLDRRWTYWMTFSQDVCWSLYVGREFCVPKPPTNAETFKAVSMPLVDLDFDQLPWDHPAAKIEPQPNYLTKTFEATCELLMIARRIMDVVNTLEKSRSRPAAIDEQISEIDLSLNTWKGRLSAELDITVKSRPTATPHKLMLHLSYWWLFILLHRPFFQRKGHLIYTTDREIDHVKLCRRASENIMELLSTWRSLYTLRYCPITLIQTVFSAGTVYLLTAVQASSGTRIAQKELRHSIDQQELVLQYLEEIGRSWQCATNIARIMKNLVEEQLKPLLERKTIPIAASYSGSLLFAQLIGDNDEDGSAQSSKSRVRRHSSLTKPKPHCLGLHSREHSVNNPPEPSPSRSTASLSPVITISHAHHDSHSPTTYALSSSPARSAPINIRAPPSRDSPFSSGASSFPSSLTDPWMYRPTNMPVSAAGSPSPSHISLYPTSTSLLSSASSQTSFVHRDVQQDQQQRQQQQQQYPPGSYSYLTASAPPRLDELAFAGSGHTNSHMFNTASSSSGLFDIPQDLDLDLDLGEPSSPASSPYASKEMTAYLGMPGGQMLSQAPSVVGLSFAALSLSPDPGAGSARANAGFASSASASSLSAQLPTFVDQFINFIGAPPAGPLAGPGPGFEDMSAVDSDANMDGDSQWDMWSSF